MGRGGTSELCTLEFVVLIMNLKRRGCRVYFALLLSSHAVGACDCILECIFIICLVALTRKAEIMATACRHNAHKLRCGGGHDLSVTVGQVSECRCIRYNTIVPMKFLLPRSPVDGRSLPLYATFARHVICPLYRVGSTYERHSLVQTV